MVGFASQARLNPPYKNGSLRGLFLLPSRPPGGKPFSVAIAFFSPSLYPDAVLDGPVARARRPPMSGRGALLRPILWLFASSAQLPAQRPADPVADELAVQAALRQGRQLLLNGQTRQAVEVLESRLA